jgi:hypothetical protein
MRLSTRAIVLIVVGAAIAALLGGALVGLFVAT